MYRLETENFLLELDAKVYQDDLIFPVNANLNIKVFSYGFSAESVMDIDTLRLADFAVQIHKLYETLNGSARLEEPYGFHCYIEFTACGGGHIKITGNIHSGKGYGSEQELAFENEIDQTYLKSFSKELLADYAKYAERQRSV
ncbi:MAG: hypothetical protein HFE78_06540 [Clostridiales bacterium]|nr:hypothetical protein [Clostridiales bacterium]